MQALTGKEITIQKKEELTEALNSAIEYHKSSETAVAIVRADQNSALWYAAVSGHHLLKCKHLVPSGDWLEWVLFNFCAPLNVALRTAQRYMLIASVNAKALAPLDAPRVALTGPDLEILSSFKFDTIRKHAISLVPEKVQPEHKGNKKFPRLANFLNVANEYARIKQRHTSQLQLVDFEEARQELGEFYSFLKWLYGDSANDPWQ